MKNINTNWFVRSRLKMRHLLLLLAINETLNINLAASQLGISQPAASKLLKELEDNLQVMLFDRQVKGVSPTVYGQIFIQYAQQIVQNLDNIYDDINNMTHGYTGKVNIGTILTPCASLIPTIVCQVKKDYPNLELSIQTGSSQQLTELFDNGELDIILCRYVKRHRPEAFVYHEIEAEPVRLCAYPEHRLVEQANIELMQVQDDIWILPQPGSVLRNELMRIYYDEGLNPPSNIVIAENLLMVTSLLQYPNMLTLLPQQVMDYYQKLNLLQPLLLKTEFQHKLDAALGEYGLLYRNEKDLSPSSKKVVTCLLQYLKKEKKR